MAQIDQRSTNQHKNPDPIILHYNVGPKLDCLKVGILQMAMVIGKWYYLHYFLSGGTLFSDIFRKIQMI